MSNAGKCTAVVADKGSSEFDLILLALHVPRISSILHDFSFSFHLIRSFGNSNLLLLLSDTVSNSFVTT